MVSEAFGLEPRTLDWLSHTFRESSYTFRSTLWGGFVRSSSVNRDRATPFVLKRITHRPVYFIHCTSMSQSRSMRQSRCIKQIKTTATSAPLGSTMGPRVKRVHPHSAASVGALGVGLWDSTTKIPWLCICSSTTSNAQTTSDSRQVLPGRSHYALYGVIATTWSIKGW